MKKIYFNARIAISLIVFLISFQITSNPLVFTWQEGDQKNTVVLNPNFIAEIQGSNRGNSDKSTLVLPVADAKVKNSLSKGSLPKSYLGQYSEVFEEVGSGRKMSLPGDIFVEFESDWNEQKVKEWAFVGNLTIKEKLISTRNIYRIQTNPGLESLTLANRLLAKPGVKSSFPNWWRESVRR